MTQAVLQENIFVDQNPKTPKPRVQFSLFSNSLNCLIIINLLPFANHYLTLDSTKLLTLMSFPYVTLFPGLSLL